MSKPTSHPNQLSLGVLVLWVAVCAVYCLNLKILVDHRDSIALIWEQFLRCEPAAPSRWSSSWWWS